MNAVFNKQVVDFVSSLEIVFVFDYPFIRIPDKNIIIHLVPVQHCSNLKYFQELSIKYEEKGFLLIHLWEDIWFTRQSLVETRIRALLGQFTSIHARKTKVLKIDKLVLDNFLHEHHLQGSPQVKYKYGLFYLKKLVAVASFGSSRPILRDGILYSSAELVRFANYRGYRVVGGLGKLLSAFVEDTHPDDIMTYADRDWSRGHSYGKMGFKYEGDTEPQIFYVHPTSYARYYSHRLPENITEQVLLDDGYIRVSNAGSKKYIKRLR